MQTLCVIPDCSLCIIPAVSWLYLSTMPHTHQSSSSSSSTMTSRSPVFIHPGRGSPPMRRNSVLSNGTEGSNGDAQGSSPHAMLSSSSSFELFWTPTEIPHPHYGSPDSLSTVKSSDHVRTRSSARISSPKGPRTSAHNPAYAAASNGSSHLRTSVVSVNASHPDDSDGSPVSPSVNTISDHPPISGAAYNAECARSRQHR